MNIYEIAKLANVSPSTVSKVINGKDEISDATKKLVLEVIREYDFHPRISTNISDKIGVFFRKSEYSVFTSPYMNTLLIGLSDYFFDWGYDLLLMPSNKIPVDKQRFRVFCHKQRMGGGVFLDLHAEDDYVQKIDGIIPMVTINAQFAGEQMYSVSSDDYSGACKAMQLLLDMGHRRIGFAYIDPHYQAHSQRLKGYKDMLTKNGIAVDNDLLFDASITSERQFQMIVENWERMGKLPTAIIAMNDQEAIKIISYLRGMGRRIPEDMSIIGFDNYPYLEHESPPLTTVAQPIYDLGKNAAMILCKCLNNRANEIGGPNCVLEETLIVRRSVSGIT